ncbi:MAG TPA: cupredoxin domain-containing protein [Mycobacteriales bacterium]|nr:cupredoxin domain-containing protein [Mycobacteriales bacterium]
MIRLLRLAAAAAAVAMAVAACSSGDDNSGSAAPGAAATTSAAAPTTSAPAGGEGSGGGAGQSSGTITIQNFAFGDPITVAPGATITVTNQDAAAHDAISDDGKFTTPLLKQGESATFTAPTEPGKYKFSCSVHANMTGIGTLTVSG